MRPDSVRELYNEDTARTYNERWHGDPWGNDTQHLAEAIGRRVHPGVRWLDVGCGTGHFLSRFPGIERAGTDLSPSMLAEAREASPDALFFEEWDFRNDNPAWRDGFTLVTCTGEPWSYVETIAETEQFVANLANWTAPGGTCLLAAQDPLDLTGLHLPYHIPGEPGFPGEIVLKAVVWSMSDRSHEHIPEIGTKWHHDLVWPLLDHWIATFGLYFRTIIIETLPHDPPWLNTPRRVLLAKDKRAVGDLTPVNVIHTSAASAYHEMVAPADAGPASDAGSASDAGEVEVNDATEPEPRDVAPVDDGAVAAHEEADPVAPAEPVQPVDPVAPMEPVEPVEPVAPVPLKDQSLSELASKVRPLRPKFWRSVARRLRKS